MMIMVTFTGAPVGGFVGGQVVSLLLHEGFGWPIIFIIGGAFPLSGGRSGHCSGGDNRRRRKKTCWRQRSGVVGQSGSRIW
jgi:MFS family permease